MTPEQLAARGVRVKPLVWVDETRKYSYPHRWAAKIPNENGDYSLTGNTVNDQWQWFRNGYFVQGHQHHAPMPLADAKAAAEADHIARICAALEMMEDGE